MRIPWKCLVTTQAPLRVAPDAVISSSGKLSSSSLQDASKNFRFRNLLIFLWCIASASSITHRRWLSRGLWRHHWRNVFTIGSSRRVSVVSQLSWRWCFFDGEFLPRRIYTVIVFSWVHYDYLKARILRINRYLMWVLLSKCHKLCRKFLPESRSSEAIYYITVDRNYCCSCLVLKVVVSQRFVIVIRGTFQNI